MRLALSLLVVLGTGCNDLTAPTPAIAGAYLYSATSPAGQTRRGTVNIYDDDRRTARFTGQFDYRQSNAASVAGTLQGAFVRADRIWFQFLSERGVYHEADLTPLQIRGEIFVQSIEYRRSGWTFTLTRLP